MTGNRFGDLIPTTLRLLVRPPWRVPQPLRGVWTLVWLVLVSAPTAYLVMSPHLAGIQWAVIGSGLGLAVMALTVRQAKAGVTASFVDVVRYLDTSPRSYSARREIRGGMVDLLRALHDGHYSRIVVVAHSLGAYIAYDALSALWAETHALHAGSDHPARTEVIDLQGLTDLERAADALLKSTDEVSPEQDVAEYQRKQFALWKDLRSQGNPWRVTDFITVGTPMYLANLLCTRPGWRRGFIRIVRRQTRGQPLSDELFEEMMRRGALVRCPPRSETQAVEDLTPPKHMSYGWDNGPRQVLGSQAVFAVVRWTNLWFPVEKGFFGDWFGGPLQPRFGPGIRDVPVTGNRPGRLCPALAHSYYFRYPDANEKNDIAREIRDALALNMYADLCELRTAPAPDPRTVGTLRRAQLSMMATVNDRRPGSVGAPT